VRDDPDNNAATPDDSNQGQALMAYPDINTLMGELAQLGTAPLDMWEFPVGYSDTADLLISWLA
jgi:hypothetical protein